MTEEEATTLFTQIAGENSDSISEEQLATAMAPPPPPAGGGGVGGAGGGGDSEDSVAYDPLDTNKDGIVSLQEYLAGQASSAEADTDEGVGAFMQQILAAIKSYQSLVFSDDSTTSSLAQQTLSISA